MSVMEIYDQMESFCRCRERGVKEKLSMLFLLAENTAEHIGCYLNSENRARKPWDVFPELFGEEKEAYEAAKADQELKEAKENRKAYAAELKKRHGAGGL